MEDLDVAADFCRLVQSADLLEYLGLPQASAPEPALAALATKRKHLQGMQANPKFKESAVYLIKNYKALERVLAQPAAHVSHQRKGKEAEKLPMLEMAIGSILADGHVSVEEETYLRKAALDMGISLETYERVLRERAAAKGATLPDRAAPLSMPPVWKGGRTLTSDEAASEERKKLQGAAGYTWWDAHFTRMLLEAIPGGPGDMIDVYCRTALSALTLLPERRQLSYLGIDRNPERVEQARQACPHGRVSFELGEPDALPVESESVDYVLAIRALANLDDTSGVFAEARRVLRPGGRMIVAEPDGIGETFYFDGHLADYNAAFHRLCRRVDDLSGGPSVPRIGKPGIALGPKLGERMMAANLRPDRIDVHASSNVQLRGFPSLSRRLRGYPVALARQVGLDERHPDLLAVHAAVDRLELSLRPESVGMGGNVLTMFLCVGIKD